MKNKHTAIDRTPYTYFLKHKITGRKYYGVRTAKKCHPKNYQNMRRMVMSKAVEPKPECELKVLSKIKKRPLDNKNISVFI
jgi:hypothetical protein